MCVKSDAVSDVVDRQSEMLVCKTIDSILICDRMGRAGNDRFYLLLSTW